MDAAVLQSTAGMLTRLIHAGGKVLVVGGYEIGSLPERYQGHPSLVLWDDHQQSIDRKEIPDNVKAVLTTKWISHANWGRLKSVADKRRLLQFPNLRPREIKELLAGIINELPDTVALSTFEDSTADRAVDDMRPAAQAIQIQLEQEAEEGVAKKPIKSGTLQEFIAKNLDVTKSYAKRGSVAAEVRRLWPMVQKAGIKTTEGSFAQATQKFVRDLAKGRTAKPARGTPDTVSPTATKKKSGDDFDELMDLLSDAVTALKLVQEHMPKVRKEVEKLRGIKERMLKAMGETE